MADPRLSSSSTFQININLPATMNQIDYSSLAKTLNSNVPMKLDKSNYIYWKTQVMPAIRALDLEDYISGLAVIPKPYIDVHTHIEGEGTLIQKQLQNIKKGSNSISDFVLKIKNIGDALMAAGEKEDLMADLLKEFIANCVLNLVMVLCNAIGILINNFRDLLLQITKLSSTTESCNDFSALVAVKNNSVIWHAKLEHPAPLILKKVFDALHFRYNVNALLFCDSCKLGKLHKLPFARSEIHATTPLQLVYSDV
ncbi:hypothetical protein ACOSQ2_019929 [Xanthoceras sorbifolium]